MFKVAKIANGEWVVILAILVFLVRRRRAAIDSIVRDSAPSAEGDTGCAAPSRDAAGLFVQPCAQVVGRLRNGDQGLLATEGGPGMIRKGSPAELKLSSVVLRDVRGI
jgi:hypothetical protein